MTFHPTALFAVSAAVFLTACAPTPPDDRVDERPAAAELPTEEQGEGDGGLADIELCEADAYRPLIGTNIAATSLPAGPMLRAFALTDIVTQDYLPQRTNIVYDDGGTITRVYCG